MRQKKVLLRGLTWVLAFLLMVSGFVIAKEETHATGNITITSFKIGDGGILRRGNTYSYSFTLNIESTDFYGFTTDAKGVTIDNAKRTITFGADAPSVVLIKLASKKYENGEWTGEYDSEGIWGAVTSETLKVYDSLNDYYDQYFSVGTDSALIAGNSVNISASCRDTDADPNVNYKVSDLSITTSDPNISVSGTKVTASANVRDSVNAKLTVTATVEGEKITKILNLTINGRYSSLSAEETTVAVKLGKTVKLPSLYLMENKLTESKGIELSKSPVVKSDKVSYTVKDKKLGNVSSDGIFTASMTTVGETVVTATVVREGNSYSRDIKIVVYEKGKPLTKSDIKKPATTGKVITVASWNDDFERTIAVFKKRYPEYADMIRYVNLGLGGTSEEYMTGIDALQKSDKAADIIVWDGSLTEYAFSKDYIVPLEKVGFDTGLYADAYPYTIARGQKGGKLYAMTYEAYPCGFLYNIEVAEKLWGDSSPEFVHEKVKDWDAFFATAEELKKRGISMVADVSRMMDLILQRSSTKIVSGNDVYLKGCIDDCFNYSKKLFDNGYVLKDKNSRMVDAWSTEWSDSFYNNDNFGTFCGVSWMSFVSMNDPAQKRFAVCEGPLDGYWGGSFLTATNAGHNDELVAFLLNSLADDEDLLEDITREKELFVNDQTVNEELINARFNKEPWTYSPWATWDRIAKKVTADYEGNKVYIVEGSIYSGFHDYFEGVGSLDTIKNSIQSELKRFNLSAHFDQYGPAKDAPLEFEKKIAIENADYEIGDIALTNDKKGIYEVEKVGKKGKISLKYKLPVNAKATSVKIPATVKLSDKKNADVINIAGNAFNKMTKLKKLTIGNNITVIGKNAFAGAKNLQTVKLGTGITTIGDNAFSGLKKLKSVIIPSKVKKIGKNAFKNCSKLKKVTIKSTKLKTLGKNAFKGIAKNATIVVPKKKLKAYSRAIKKSGVDKTVTIK